MGGAGYAMDRKSYEAIERANNELFDSLRSDGERFMDKCCEALDVRTGIPEVDNLLPYCDGAGAEFVVAARNHFLRALLYASDEPDDAAAAARERQKKADAAAVSLRSAAHVLGELDNAALGALLDFVAESVELNAATCTLQAHGLSRGDKPLLFLIPSPHRRSADYDGARGPTSGRANVLRMVAQSLKPDTPPSLLARLLSDVLGIETTIPHVYQSLKLQHKPAPDTGGDSPARLEDFWAKP